MSFRSVLQFSLGWDWQINDGADRYVVDHNALAMIDEIKDTDTDLHVVFHERRTLPAGGSQSYDLAGGIVDHFGNLRTLSTVKAIVVRNLSTALNAILEVGGGSNAFASWLGASGDVVTVNPSGLFLKYEPLVAYGVTAGTGDILTLSSDAVTQYDIAIVGLL